MAHSINDQNNNADNNTNDFTKYKSSKTEEISKKIIKSELNDSNSININIPKINFNLILNNSQKLNKKYENIIIVNEKFNNEKLSSNKSDEKDLILSFFKKRIPYKCKKCHCTIIYHDMIYKTDLNPDNLEILYTKDIFNCFGIAEMIRTSRTEIILLCMYCVSDIGVEVTRRRYTHNLTEKYLAKSIILPKVSSRLNPFPEFVTKEECDIFQMDIFKDKDKIEDYKQIEFLKEFTESIMKRTSKRPIIEETDDANFVDYNEKLAKELLNKPSDLHLTRTKSEIRIGNEDTYEWFSVKKEWLYIKYYVIKRDSLIVESELN
ncbi:hypothetical protein B5S32_g5377 [[Candida] boidinii]|nr:hypothetical protein B5S32_g5377 [[Candida] boidinii]